MPPTEPEMAKNPMKKRFRSWQPNEDAPAPRRRRYPQLVVRDGSGHHIAHDIATAPKVELPLPAIMPRTLPSTRNPQRDYDEIQPNVKRESEIDEPEPDSPLGSASTLDRTHHMDGHSGLRSPSSPFYEKSRPRDDHSGLRSPSVPFYEKPLPRNNAIMPPSGNSNHRPPLGTSPPTQPSHAPVSGARVNPVVMHSQSVYANDTPSYPAKPNTLGGCAPYNSTSYPPPPGNQSMGPTYPQGNASYPAKTSPYVKPEQPQRYSNNVAGDNTQRANAYQTQPTGHTVPQTGNRQSAPEPQAPRRTPAQEKVILAGKRCGTVEYWRSSLQMPRENGVIKSLKAPPQYYKRKARQETPEQPYQTQPTNNAPLNPTSVLPRASTGQASGQPPPSYTAYQRPPQRQPQPQPQPQPPRNMYPEDYTDESASDGDYSSPERGDSQPEHEFWRSATKLPRSNIDSARMKRLASGKRRLDRNDLPYDELPRESIPTCISKDVRSNLTPPPARQYGTPHQPGSAVPRMQTEYIPQTHTPAQGAVQTGISAAQQLLQAASQSYLPQGQARMGRPKAQSETRRLLFLRDFEMRRLKTNAQGKFHVKMNLRGRAKLENWICSDEISWEATNFVLSMFNTDRRVLSKNDDVRRNALYDMSNEDLRILEALMARIQSRGGRQNWEMLVLHLPYEDFVNVPMNDG